MSPISPAPRCTFPPPFTFAAGVNTLEFRTFNSHGGPTGLRVEIGGTAAAVPEPSSLALLGVGLAGALAFARRRRRAPRAA